MSDDGDGVCRLGGQLRVLMAIWEAAPDPHAPPASQTDAGAQWERRLAPCGCRVTCRPVRSEEPYNTRIVGWQVMHWGGLFDGPWLAPLLQKIAGRCQHHSLPLDEEENAYEADQGCVSTRGIWRAVRKRAACSYEALIHALCYLEAQGLLAREERGDKTFWRRRE